VRLLILLAVVVVATGCRSHERVTVKTVAVTTSAATTEPNESVVHVYFCTSDTCASEATHAQEEAVKREALASPLVASVLFVSKEKALEQMKQKYPGAVAQLPRNLFPDALRVFPANAYDIAKVAALFSGQPGNGIDKVDYPRPLTTRP